MTSLLGCHFWKTNYLFSFYRKPCFPNAKHKTDLKYYACIRIIVSGGFIIFFSSEMIYYFNYMVMLKILIFSKYFYFIDFLLTFDKIFLKFFFISKALFYLKIIITNTFHETNFIKCFNIFLLITNEFWQKLNVMGKNKSSYFIFKEHKFRSLFETDISLSRKNSPLTFIEN